MKKKVREGEKLSKNLKDLLKKKNEKKRPLHNIVWEEELLKKREKNH